MDLSEMLVSPAHQDDASSVATPANDAAIDALRDLIVAKLTYATGRDPLGATDRDWFVAAALALRDRIVDRWLHSARDDTSNNRKRVYYLSLEFLPGRLLLDSLNNAGLTEPMRLALGRARRRPRAAAHHRARSRTRQWRARSAGRLLHGEHGEPGHSRLRLRHSLQFRAVPAGDPRRLAARIPRGLALAGQSVGVRTTRCAPQGELRRLGGYGAGRGRHVPRGLAPARYGDRHRLRHAGGRLARPPCEHAAPVVGTCAGPAGTRDIQPRRPCRRAGRPRAGERDLADPLPERRDARRPGTATAPGVFLLLRLAAGPAAPAYPAVRRGAQPGGQMCDPAERYASRDRRRRS